MASINSIYSERLIAVAAAMARLNKMGISIIEIDLNRARPVMTVQPCAAVNNLKGAQYSRRGTPTGMISRMQAKLEKCRIEWEVRA